MLLQKGAQCTDMCRVSHACTPLPQAAYLRLRLAGTCLLTSSCTRAGTMLVAALPALLLQADAAVWAVLEPLLADVASCGKAE